MPYKTDTNDLTTRIYVASGFQNYPLVREVADQLREEGFHVTYDWTLTDEFHEDGTHAIPDDEMTPDEVLEDDKMWAYAELDRRGVRTADVVLLLAEGQDAMKGAYWECGIADALGIPIVVVNPLKRCIFFCGNFVFLVDTIDEALDLISDLNVRVPR